MALSGFVRTQPLYKINVFSLDHINFPEERLVSLHSYSLSCMCFSFMFYNNCYYLCSCHYRTRQENKAKGLAFLRAGNKQQAVECFQKSVDITPEMALEVIKVHLLSLCTR